MTIKTQNHRFPGSYRDMMADLGGFVKIDSTPKTCYFTATSRKETNMLFFLCALAFTAYVSTGYCWGHISHKAWQKKRRSIAGLLCFPVSYARDKIGAEPHEFQGFVYKGHMGAFIAELAYADPLEYKLIMTMAWPLKLAFNIPVLAALALWHFSHASFNPGYFFTVKEVFKELPEAKALPPKQI